jgi:isopentenyl-diphosphate delta-isomerase
MTYPLIQIVNDQDEPVGAGSLQEIYQKGLRHRVVYIFCEDTDGKILLQKRGPSMATFPNCWDVSAAGHVDEGETYERATKRELQEELGLSGFKLKVMRSFYDEFVVDGHSLKRFCKVYKVVIPAGVSIQPDPLEVAEIRWLTIPEINKLIAEHPNEVANGLHKIPLS